MRRPVLVLAPLILACCGSAALAETFPARVVGISDGDTITVLAAGNQHRKIRLAGIDAPEKKQAFGQRSRQHLADLVFGKNVVLDCVKVDRYRRDVCVVLVGGRDANLAQVEAGMAWWYRKYSREQTAQQRVDYEAAEGRARAARAGLWVDPYPVPPWEWRKRQRQ